MAIWVGYPASYSPGRNRPVQYVVIHYTAGSEGPTSAEAGADYDKRRADGTSTHCFADSNSVVREVPDGDRAHHARWHGNEIGLGLEICGTAQTREQWLDATSLPTLRNAAGQTAEWCRLHGLPVRRLSVAETRAAYYAAPGSRPKGIVGHVDCTEAYPEDEGTHTDPGTAFPWDVFLQMVREEMGDDMTPQELLSTPLGRSGPTVAIAIQDSYRRTGELLTAVAGLVEKIDDLQAPQVDASAVAQALAANTEFLAALAAAINAETRDALADFGTGGVAAVRADDDTP